MHVGVLRISLHIPHARSLKEKRSVVRRFRDRVRARFEVSIAEVDAQDLLQRAVFGVSVATFVYDDALPAAAVTENVRAESAGNVASVASPTRNTLKRFWDSSSDLH